jgi:lipid II:glycine glycyltransferase (peptidoglycan interpeptide bridge formation enzyme)
MLRTLIAKVDGADIGALMLLLYKDLVYYWYTGTLREFASHRPGDMLVWHSLEFGSQNGFRLYDFGGGGKPAEEYGVRDFKAKFGGELVNFGRNVCIHAPFRLKLSQEGYQMVRRFIS